MTLRTNVSPFETPKVQDALPGVNPRAARALKYSVLSSLMTFLSALLLSVNMPLVRLLAGGAGVVGLIGTVAGLVSVGQLMMGKGARFDLLRAPVAVLLGLYGFMSNAAILMMSFGPFARGRQLREYGRLKFASLVEGSLWSAGQVKGDAAPAWVAEAWRKNGLTEHASVAAFARLSTELMALGAPPALVEAAHKDALDELQHTKLCFELAESFDGKKVGRKIGPGGFPAAAGRQWWMPRPARLVRLALESLVDGAMNEGISARVVAGLLKEVEDPRVKRVLSCIAKDEARHAAHGFDVLRWCLKEGGAPVAIALRKAVLRLPKTFGRGLVNEAESGEWERYGLPGRAREAEAFKVVRARVVARVERLLSTS